MREKPGHVSVIGFRMVSEKSIYYYEAELGQTTTTFCKSCKERLRKPNTRVNSVDRLFPGGVFFVNSRH